MAEGDTPLEDLAIQADRATEAAQRLEQALRLASQAARLWTQMAARGGMGAPSGSVSPQMHITVLQLNTNATNLNTIATANNSQRLLMLSSSIDRLTAASRVAATTGGLSAAASVVQSASTAGAIGTFTAAQAQQVKTSQRSDEQRQKDRDRRAAQREADLNARVAAAVSAIRGVPIETNEEAARREAAGVPFVPIETQSPFDPDTERAAFEQSEADLRRQRLENLHARLPASVLQDPETLADRERKSDQGAKRSAEERRRLFEDNLAKRTAAAALAGMDPSEMTPEESRRAAAMRSRAPGSGRGGAGGAGGAGGGGGGGGAGGAGGAGGGFLNANALIAALAANTAATIANTATMAVLASAAAATAATTAAVATAASRPTPTPKKKKKDKDDETSFSDFVTGAAIAAAGISSMVSVADPSAFSTFTGSIKILSAEVGQVFVPYIDALSRGIQNAAAAFDHAGPTVRGWVGGLGAAALAIGAVTVAMRVLTPVTNLATGAIKGMWSALTFLATTPLGRIISGLTFVAGLVVSLTGNWNNLADAIGGAANRAGQFAGVVKPDKPKAIGELDEFKNLPAAMQAQLTQSGIKPDQQKKIFDDHISGLEKQLQEQQQLQLPLIGKEKEAAATREKFMEPFRKEMEKELSTANQYIKAFATDDQFTRRREKLINDQVKKAADLSLHLQEEAVEKAKEKGLPLNLLEAQQAIGIRFEDNRLTLPGSGNVRPRDAAGPAAQRIQELEKQIQGAQLLRERAGVSGGADNFIQNLKLPIQARTTTAESFAESVQAQALNVMDTEAKVIEKNLESLISRTGEGNLLLRSINLNLEALVRASGGAAAQQDEGWFFAGR